MVAPTWSYVKGRISYRDRSISPVSTLEFRESRLHTWLSDSIGHNGSVQQQRIRVLVLGSTGSIGTQALEVMASDPDRFEVVGLAAGGANIELLTRQLAETGTTNVAVADPAAAKKLGSDGVLSGPDAVTELVRRTSADVILNALVGSLGLEPTLAALESGARQIGRAHV